MVSQKKLTNNKFNIYLRLYFFNNISIYNDSINSIDAAGDYAQADTEQL